MPHVTTRVKDKVDATTGAEMLCRICGEWKRPDQFLTYEKDRYYQTHCKRCLEVSNKMRVKGVHPSITEIRKAVKAKISFAGALNKARHGGVTKAKPLGTLAKEELRERREEKDGVPSMCYLIGMKDDNSAVKIGHSTNVYRRMAQYQAGNPRKLVVLALLPGGQAKEQELHRKFIHYHMDWMVGEWFRRAPEIMNHFASGKVKA